MGYVISETIHLTLASPQDQERVLRENQRPRFPFSLLPKLSTVRVSPRPRWLKGALSVSANRQFLGEALCSVSLAPATSPASCSPRSLHSTTFSISLQATQEGNAGYSHLPPSAAPGVPGSAVCSMFHRLAVWHGLAVFPAVLVFSHGILPTGSFPLLWSVPVLVGLFY